jgi:predicted acylesterase/phospholipase RssA
MKGGLTSGVVYPATVLALAKEYKFHSVGGTSAGAIAAAVTAAAEAGRAAGGFEKLEQVAKEIAEPGFLLKIFRATGAARAVMNLFVSLLARRPKKPGKLRKLWFFGPALHVRLMYHIPCAFLLGAIVGIVSFAAAAYLTARIGHCLAEWARGTVVRAPFEVSPAMWGCLALCAAAGLIVGSIVGPVLRILYVVFRHLPRDNFFGICTGYIPGDSSVLTNWLHKKINELCGRTESDDAVTFAELETAGVKFKAISTNLAQNRPYIFPREPEGFRLVFDERQLERLFPPTVIKVLKRPTGESRGPKLPEGYFYLPERGDLPVVVATRMSLSFPVLISAIPMHEVKRSAYKRARDEAAAAGKDVSQIQLSEEDLHAHWFSDGGICSNFPIGLFDVWLPKHPTFGINLNYLKSGEKRDSRVPSDKVPAPEDTTESTMDDVHLPQVGDRIRPQWNAIDKLPTFLSAILDSARNYRDTLQSMLPSYSERIVQVWLDPEEGGMNLTMDEDKIASLIGKGGQAGDKLAGMDFQGHRCMRLRVLMKVLCCELEDLHKSYPTVADYKAVAQSPGTWCANRDPELWPDIEPYVTALNALTAAWTAGASCSHVFDKMPPTFEGDLHVHPKV